MNNANLSLSHRSVTGQSGDDLVTIDRTPTALGRIQQVTALATSEQHKTAHYSTERLAAELRRQGQIIARKGGATPEQKLKLQSLTLDCMSKLQAVNGQLSGQLAEIISR